MRHSSLFGAFHCDMRSRRQTVRVHQSPKRRRNGSVVERLDDRVLLSEYPISASQILAIGGAASAVGAEAYTLDLTTDDPSNTLGWSINWGDGSPAQNVANVSSVTHVFPAGSGSYNVSADVATTFGTFAAQVGTGGTFQGAFVPSGGALGFPGLMTFGPDGNGDGFADLYVSNRISGASGNNVLRYSGADGSFLGVFVPAGAGGLDQPGGLLATADVSGDGVPEMLVASENSDTVLRFDGLTGDPLPGPGQTGATFIPAGSGGLDAPRALQLGSDGALYVGCWEANKVLRFNATSGAFLSTFVPAGSGGLGLLNPMVFGPDGNGDGVSDLYVSNYYANNVLRYSGANGSFLGVFVTANSGGLTTPTGITFGPDGHLYVGSGAEDSVFRYNGATGAFIDRFATGGGLDWANGVIFGADDQLYVASAYTGSILRYAGPFEVSSSTILNVSVIGRTTYNSPNVPQTIKNNKTIRSTLNIPHSITIADVNVSLNISHGADADLDVFLVAPDGTRVELFTDVGGGGANFTGTVLTDEASQSTTTGSAPFTGQYRPESSLATLDGKNATGTWTLEITDDTNNKFTGQLNSWSLSIAHAGGSSLIAASARRDRRGAVSLSRSDLKVAVDAAIAGWHAAGVDVHRLGKLDVRIADLPGREIGWVSGSSIVIDKNAAGWGWSEGRARRASRSVRVLVANARKMDLLTAVSHEIGHVLGIAHSDHGVMADTLRPGVRRLPSARVR